MPICVEPRNQHRRADGGPPHDLIERLRLNTDLERFGRENRPKHPFQDDSAWYLRFPSRDFERLNSTIKNGDMTSLKYAFDHGYPVNTQDRFYKTALVSLKFKNNDQFLRSKNKTEVQSLNLRPKKYCFK